MNPDNGGVPGAAELHFIDTKNKNNKKVAAEEDDEDEKKSTLEWK